MNIVPAGLPPIVRGSVILAAFALMSCNAMSGDNDAQANDTADATAPRAIPCSVQAHGIDAVQARLQQRPRQEPCDDSVNAQTVPLDELIRIIPDQHPSFYYVLATRLFQADRKDEAVFWFYAGQLRYRSRLACHPELPPGTEPALFASLQEVTGTPINEYAGADPDAWVAAMERARAWDATTRNGFEPREPCRAAIAEQRAGMGQLIDYVRANKAQIRQERASRGLPNR